MYDNQVCKMYIYIYTVKPVLNGLSQKVQKIVFQDQLSLNAGK